MVDVDTDLFLTHAIIISSLVGINLAVRKTLITRGDRGVSLKICQCCHVDLPSVCRRLRSAAVD